MILINNCPHRVCEFDLYLFLPLPHHLHRNLIPPIFQQFLVIVRLMDVISDAEGFYFEADYAEAVFWDLVDFDSEFEVVYYVGVVFVDEAYWDAFVVGDEFFVLSKAMFGDGSWR